MWQGKPSKSGNTFWRTMLCRPNKVPGCYACAADAFCNHAFWQMTLSYIPTSEQVRKRPVSPSETVHVSYVEPTTDYEISFWSSRFIRLNGCNFVLRCA